MNKNVTEDDIKAILLDKTLLTDAIVSFVKYLHNLTLNLLLRKINF